jgi:hypothetical protein
LITGGAGKRKTGAFLAGDKFNIVIKLFSGIRERTAWFRALIAFEAVR